jgi:hypothetical protein
MFPINVTNEKPFWVSAVPITLDIFRQLYAAEVQKFEKYSLKWWLKLTLFLWLIFACIPRLEPVEDDSWFPSSLELATLRNSPIQYSLYPLVDFRLPHSRISRYLPIKLRWEKANK